MLARPESPHIDFEWNFKSDRLLGVGKKLVDRTKKKFHYCETSRSRGCCLWGKTLPQKPTGFVRFCITPHSPLSGPAQRVFQESSAKSKFLADLWESTFQITDQNDPAWILAGGMLSLPSNRTPVTATPSPRNRPAGSPDFSSRFLSRSMVGESCATSTVGRVQLVRLFQHRTPSASA